MITVSRPSGLLVPFEPPELTIDQAIERNWRYSDDGRLMVPEQEEYLPTYPLDRPWEFAPARIPWRDNGPFFVGLPAV